MNRIYEQGGLKTNYRDLYQYIRHQQHRNICVRSDH